MSIAAITGAILMSLSPILEVRAGIPFAVAKGINIWVAFLICVLANIILIPLVFLFLDYAHDHLMKISIYSGLFNLYLGRVRRKAENKIHGTWPYVVLFSFVGLPLPGTGVWTGVLVSWFFKMNRKRSYIALILGSICVSLVVVLITLGVVSIW